MFCHTTSVLNVKINPQMPQMKSKDVFEGKGPVPQDLSGLDELTIEEVCRTFSEELDKFFDRGTSHFAHERFENTKEKNTNQRLARLEHEARQSHLATEANVEPDTKTRKHTEGASAADRVKNGESSSARLDDGLTTLTNFGMIAKPPAPEKYISDALVNKGAETPKPHLPLRKVGILSSAAGGLLSAGTASTATRTIFQRRRFSWSLDEATKEITGRTNFNPLAPSSWRKVIQKKSRKTLVLDCGGCSCRLRDWPFLEGWRALLRGEVRLGAGRYLRLERFC